jgi:hypothetical protein
MLKLFNDFQGPGFDDKAVNATSISNQTHLKKSRIKDITVSFNIWVFEPINKNSQI